MDKNLPHSQTGARSVSASPTSPEVIPVIPVDVPHPGAGTTVIDAAVSEEGVFSTKIQT